jgi:hypothetical protein
VPRPFFFSTLAVFSLACGSSSPSVARTPGDPLVTAGVEQLRAATRPYLSIDSAAAAGYAREVKDCLVHEHHGAMGYHHTNPRFADAKVEIERPEILLYERMPDGRYRLNGVEFIVPYRFWPRDSIPPTVMGQTMKREDNLKFFFLHVWAWTPNRDGVFSDFHPDVACAEGTSRIFRPYTAPPGG